MGLRCLHASIFIETPSLVGLPTKAKKDPSPHEMRLSLAGHQRSISWSRRLLSLLLSLLLLLLLLLLLFTVLYYAPLIKSKKENDCTTYDVEIVCLTMEI